MKNFELVIEFRKSYYGLNYLKSKYRVNDLILWTNQWCQRMGLPQDLYSVFEHLAISYVEKDFVENYIYNLQKKKNYQK